MWIRNLLVGIFISFFASSVFSKNVRKVFIPTALWDVTLQRGRFLFRGSCGRESNHSKNGVCP